VSGRLRVPLVAAALAGLVFWLPGDGFDLRIFLAAGHAVAHGHSPYPATAAQLHSNAVFVYPRLAAWLFAPLSALPAHAAEDVYTVLCAACIALGAWLLGVRSWVALAAVALGAFAIRSVTLGTVEPLLFLALAVVWRFRDRPLVAGVALGLGVLVKPILLPLGLFLLATRRFGALAAAVVSVLVAGAASGESPSTVAEYASLVRRLGDIEGPKSWSTAGWLAQSGLDWRVASTAVIALALVLASGVLVAGLRGRLDERQVFAAALALALLASPIVWTHYDLLLVGALVVAGAPTAALVAAFAASWFITPDRIWVVSPSHYVSWPPNADGVFLGQLLLVGVFAAALLPALPLARPGVTPWGRRARWRAPRTRAAVGDPKRRA